MGGGGGGGRGGLGGIVMECLPSTSKVADLNLYPGNS